EADVNILGPLHENKKSTPKNLEVTNLKIKSRGLSDLAKYRYISDSPFDD
ncbi:hypothetical protein ACJX0J_007350, partial [Zea mays]